MAETVDVVVVGFGGAGAACAIAANDLGGEVAILEKQPRKWHTPSTAMSGGIIMGVNDPENGARYLDRCSGGMVPSAVSRAWAQKAAELVDWLEKIGADLALTRVGGAEHPEFPGSEAIDAYAQSRPVDEPPAQVDLPPPANVDALAGGVANDPQVARRAGAEYFTSLRRIVDKRQDVVVHYDSPAKRLLRGADGRVSGVVAESAGERTMFNARRGVVLTCGGFEFDQEMKLNYMKASPTYFYGNPGNTGDGIRMAQDVGSDLWHMNQMVGRAVAHFEGSEGKEYNFVVGIHPPGYIITDRYGDRFANEFPQAEMKHDFYFELLKYSPAKKEHPRIPSYWLFDERRFSAGPLTSLRSGMVGAGYYEWSPDNRKEVANGWIKSGDTIEDLARIVGFPDPEHVKKTVEAYNEGCAAGLDEYGRPSETLVPLDSPPFYCVPLYPGGSNTCGGPRRDEHAQVLDAFGDPIPGLYAAGELGESIGLLYPANGANLSESVCFGRIAAAEAMGVSKGREDSSTA